MLTNSGCVKKNGKCWTKSIFLSFDISARWTNVEDNFDLINSIFSGEFAKVDFKVSISLAIDSGVTMAWPSFGGLFSLPWIAAFSFDNCFLPICRKCFSFAPINPPFLVLNSASCYKFIKIETIKKKIKRKKK